MSQFISKDLKMKSSENQFIKLLLQKLMDKSEEQHFQDQTKLPADRVQVQVNCQKDQKQTQSQPLSELYSELKEPTIDQQQTVKFLQNMEKKTQNQDQQKQRHEIEEGVNFVSFDIAALIKEKIAAKIKQFKETYININQKQIAQAILAQVEGVEQNSNQLTNDKLQLQQKQCNQTEQIQAIQVHDDTQNKTYQIQSNQQLQILQQRQIQKQSNQQLQAIQKQFIQEEKPQICENTQQNQQSLKKGQVMQEQVSYDPEQLNLEVDQVVLIVDTIKIVSRFIKDLDDESNSKLVFQLQPIYQIQSILQKENNNNEEDSNNQTDRTGVVLEDKNQKTNQTQYYRQNLPLGCLLTAKYTTSTLPKQLSVLFEKVEDLFISIKNHQTDLFNLQQLGSKILSIKIPIFQKTRVYKIPLFTSSITKQQFLERKNIQLVDQIKLLYKKFTVNRKKYKYLKNQYKKIEQFKSQFSKIRENKNEKLLMMQKQLNKQNKSGLHQMHQIGGLPPIDMHYSTRERPLAEGQEALEQDEQQRLMSGRGSKGKNGMYTRKQVKKNGY